MKRMSWVLFSCLLSSCLLMTIASSAAWADGRIELNQASIEAAGGFPYSIGTPGSYVLTSDLTVGSDIDALVFVDSGAATLDLNGFQIAGPSTCALGNCANGVASGVSGDSGSQVTIQNGTIRNFSGDCVDLQRGGAVNGLLVRECGGHGIAIASFGSVRNSRIDAVGESGILLDSESLYAHNLVGGSDYRNVGARAIVSGAATAGNVCADGSCSRRGARRYYMTPAQYTGSQVLTACEPGFHFASIHEIWDHSTLEYDAVRGYQLADSGSGPPATVISLQPVAWARVGGQSLSLEFNREANCGLWTSSSGSNSGGVWKFSNAAVGTQENERWRWFSRACNSPAHVWCLEN